MVSNVTPMSEAGFKALNRLMFSLSGLHLDPLVLLILGFRMPYAAKAEVGSVPRWVHSQLINQWEQVKCNTKGVQVWVSHSVACGHWRPLISPYCALRSLIPFPFVLLDTSDHQSDSAALTVPSSSFLLTKLRQHSGAPGGYYWRETLSRWRAGMLGCRTIRLGM